MINQKFMNGSATTQLFGSLLLVGGLAAGVVLVRQPQLLEQKASGINCVSDSVYLSANVGSYFCSDDGNVFRVATAKDPNNLCPDYKTIELVESCKPKTMGNITVNYECRTGVKEGQKYLGLTTTTGNTNIYTGGVGCVPESKIVIR